MRQIVFLIAVQVDPGIQIPIHRQIAKINNNV